MTADTAIMEGGAAKTSAGATTTSPHILVLISNAACALPHITTHMIDYDAGNFNYVNVFFYA